MKYSFNIALFEKWGLAGLKSGAGEVQSITVNKFPIAVEYKDGSHDAYSLGDGTLYYDIDEIDKAIQDAEDQLAALVQKQAARRADLAKDK